MTLRLPRGLTQGAKKHLRRARRHGVGGTLSGLMMFGVAGFILGNIDKSGTSFPTIPMLGRAGTAALALHYLGKGNKMMQQGSLACAAIAGYEFGSTGKVAGGPVRQI